MSKIFCTTLRDNKVEVVEFDSLGEFNKTEHFLDPKWIHVTNTRDILLYGAYLKELGDGEEFDTFSPVERESYTLLREVALKLVSF